MMTEDCMTMHCNRPHNLLTYVLTQGETNIGHTDHGHELSGEHPASSMYILVAVAVIMQ